MVRGAAALLGLALAALAYFLVAPALPALGSLDVAIAVAAAVGLALVVALAAAPGPAVAAPAVLVPAVLGAVLLVAVLNAARGGAAASPFEALAYGCAGVAFAAALDSPALALALPVFVGALDLSGVVGSGPGMLLAGDAARPGDPLTVELPGWGGGLPAARVTGAELVFLAVYVAYAHQLGLRPRASAIAMWAALVAAVVAGLAIDRRVPALALMSAAFLAVNGDRLAGLFRAPRSGNVPDMDLEEKTLEKVGDRCEECGAKLTQRELEQVIESGGPALCTIHAAEVVPVGEEDDLEEEV